MQLATVRNNSKPSELAKYHVACAHVRIATAQLQQHTLANSGVQLATQLQKVCIVQGVILYTSAVKASYRSRDSSQGTKRAETVSLAVSLKQGPVITSYLGKIINTLVGVFNQDMTMQMYFDDWKPGKNRVMGARLSYNAPALISYTSYTANPKQAFPELIRGTAIHYNL